MPILVFDDFNRADNPTGLGTANTGQTWTLVTGIATSFSIVSNQATWTWNPFDGNGRIIIESGATDGITKVSLPNASSLSGANFGVGNGLIFRWTDINYYWRLVYYHFGLDTRLRLQQIYAGALSTVVDTAITLNDNDVIEVRYCGPLFEVWVNSVQQASYDDSGGFTPHNYGTLCGLYGDPGSWFTTLVKTFDDFTVETNGTCAATYNCTAGSCVDPGDGTGTYATLADCLTACSVAASYNCIAGQCFDPGDGTGTFSTLTACIDSGCGGGTTGINTTRFDQGIGNSWYIVLPLIDSGDELRSKVLKAIREIGKVTNAVIKVYGYDVDAPITVSDLEDGTNSTTGGLGLSNTTQVTQSQRVQINVPNAVLHTVRIEGDDTGQSTRDTIHEIAMEQAEEGVRR